MDGCYAELTQPFHEWIAAIVGIDCPQLGLDRSGTFELLLVVLVGIENTGKPDRGVGIDQSGSGYPGPENAVSFRDGNGIRRADLFDRSILVAENHSLPERLEISGHVIEQVGLHSHLSASGGGEQAEKKRQKRGVRFHGVVPYLLKQHPLARRLCPAPKPPSAQSLSRGSSRSKTFTPSTWVSRTLV